MFCMMPISVVPVFFKKKRHESKSRSFHLCVCSIFSVLNKYWIVQTIFIAQVMRENRTRKLSSSCLQYWWIIKSYITDESPKHALLMNHKKKFLVLIRRPDRLCVTVPFLYSGEHIGINCSATVLLKEEYLNFISASTVFCPPVIFGGHYRHQQYLNFVSNILY